MNVKQVVPFLRVSNMEKSVYYYVDGLGFAIKHRWVVEGKLRWCSLTLGGSTLMLQEFPAEGRDSWKPEAKVGVGVSLCFLCEDAIAIYRKAVAHGLEASEPQVGNAMWVTTLADPDGYRLEFESETAVLEDTKLSEVNEQDLG
jgi:catechol 2,3-dioxygenase-like lactoylglutathione lyase family enzyme